MTKYWCFSLCYKVSDNADETNKRTHKKEIENSTLCKRKKLHGIPWHFPGTLLFLHPVFLIKKESFQSKFEAWIRMCAPCIGLLLV